MNKIKDHPGLTFGIILFLLIFIYLTIHMAAYFSKEQVSIYSVGEKVSLIPDSTYTGLIIREEEVVSAQSSGYINYFLESSGRCSLSSIVYSIDENGSFNEILSSGGLTSNLSSDNLSELTNDLALYSKTYDSSDFSSVYTLKNNISNKLLSYLNISSSESLKELGVDSRYFHTYTADHIGVVEYYTDGFEGYTASDVKADDFNTENYKMNMLKSGETVTTSDVAYKIITSENWKIAVQMTEEDLSRLSGKNRINVTFNETGIEATLAFEEITGADGNTYGLISTSRYMIQYADSRYLSITIDMDSEEGLKIPQSALCTKDFYAIPLEYFTTGGNTNADGLFIETVTVDGTTASFVNTTIFHEDDTYAYVSKDQLTLGSIAVKPNSQDRFAISTNATLTGVYCVNKGYAVFKVIEVIDENSDYLIVKSGTSYGISVYDNILLNASQANEGDKIY